jgi:SAM-dependent methyltransferase
MGHKKIDSSILSNLYKKKFYSYLESEEFEPLYKYISSNCVGRVLDVGCWTGMLYKNLDHNNYYGFDLCSEAIEEAKKLNIELFKVCSWYDFYKHNDNFDTIYFGGVFCYIDDKVDFLNKYLESFNPKKIIIQDIQITDLSCFIGENKYFKFEYPNLNEERKLRQVKIIQIS